MRHVLAHDPVAAGHGILKPAALVIQRHRQTVDFAFAAIFHRTDFGFRFAGKFKKFFLVEDVA